MIRSAPARVWGIACLCLSWVASAAPVQAQDEPDEEVGEEADAEAPRAAAEPDEKASAALRPAPTWWFGAYGQGVIVPSFMLGLFLDESPTVANFGFGVTATHRAKDGFSLVFGLGYTSYSFDGPFRISGDPVEDTEYLRSTLGLLHLRGQMLWSTEIVANTLSFEYGFGLDLGIVLGELRRSEAFVGAGGKFESCAAAGVPPAISPNGMLYCEPPTRIPTNKYNEEGAHYNVKEERVPPIAPIPMLPVLALRYTPIRELAVKLDFAFGLLQFAIGVSAAYGVDL